MCELLHTSPVVQKMMGYPKSKSVTVVTATEAQARQAAWAADTEACFGVTKLAAQEEAKSKDAPTSLASTQPQPLDESRSRDGEPIRHSE
jgi:hypothetical protein